MKFRVIALTAVAILGSATVCQTSGATEAVIVPGRQAEVAVQDLRVGDGVVSGMVVNNSARVVRDVKLLIHNAWLWKDERHPGPVSPGNAEFYTVSGEIQPGGSLPFTYRLPPLPRRTDGHFVTSANVVEFTQVGS